jgi:hypothetical protein
MLGPKWNALREDRRTARGRSGSHQIATGSDHRRNGDGGDCCRVHRDLVLKMTTTTDLTWRLPPDGVDMAAPLDPVKRPVLTAAGGSFARGRGAAEIAPGDREAMGQQWVSANHRESLK